MFSTIYPKIGGLKIIPVSRISNPLEVIFLIDIPQGDNPPYMAHDKRYYKRLDFQKRPMEGYEVVDCFGRRKRPKLSVSLPENHIRVTHFKPDFVDIRWDMHIKNIGKSVAREIVCKITPINANIQSVSTDFHVINDGHSQPYIKGIFTNSGRFLIFPHPTMETFLGITSFNCKINAGESQCKISYELLAENMPIVKGEIHISVGIYDEKPIIRKISFNEEEVKDW